MFLLNFLFGRAVLFTASGLAVFVGCLVFNDGEFSTGAFWLVYLLVEVGLFALGLWATSDTSIFRGGYAVGGTPTGLDGRPPWADEEDRRLAKLAATGSEDDDPNRYEN